MLEMSEKDIRNGLLVPNDQLNREDIEWLKKL
jgi:hypothetical protein